MSWRGLSTTLATPAKDTQSQFTRSCIGRSRAGRRRSGWSSFPLKDSAKCLGALKATARYSSMRFARMTGCRLSNDPHRRQLAFLALASGARMNIVVAVLMWCVPAQAQDYPVKPIRLIVATAPGGLMDVPARLMADYFEKAYGQRVVVENRGGGGGVMAGDAVAKAAPDGYTLAQIQVGNVAINPYTVKDMPFDPLADLAPVAPLTSSPVVVAVDARLGVGSLSDFIAAAKREPGKLNYGSAGPGTIPHLAGELFCQVAGVRLTPVHYRGAGPALADLLAGQVQAIFVGLGVVRTQSAVRV